jgi:hypothetical protein
MVTTAAASARERCRCSGEKARHTCQAVVRDMSSNCAGNPAIAYETIAVFSNTRYERSSPGMSRPWKGIIQCLHRHTHFS